MDRSRYRIFRIHLGNVSAYLVYTTKTAILIDTGNKGSGEKILESILQLGLSPELLRLIILTHAHFDHAGSAQKIKTLTGCKIAIHSSEEQILRNGYSSLPEGTRWKARILVGLGRTLARKLGEFPAAEPDILMGEIFDLESLGLPGKVIHTPGHTSGSMVVLMNGGELIGGDTFFGLTGKEHFPPFAEDAGALLKSWEMVRNLPVKTIYPAHGEKFTVDSFSAEYEFAIKKYR